MYLRPYEARDFGAIYALDVLCFERRFRFSRTMMRRVVGSVNALVHVACTLGPSGAEVIEGFCAAELELEQGVRIGYVATLDVSPARRGQGVGQELMRSVETAASEMGAAAMFLHVYTENAAAVRLYTALGYEPQRREPGFYGVGYDAWLYRKGLNFPGQ